MCQRSLSVPSRSHCEYLKFEITKEEDVKTVECRLHPTINIAHGCNPWSTIMVMHWRSGLVRVGGGVLRGEAGTPLVFPFRECDEGNLPLSYIEPVIAATIACFSLLACPVPNGPNCNVHMCSHRTAWGWPRSKYHLYVRCAYFSTNAIFKFRHQEM